MSRLATERAEPVSQGTITAWLQPVRNRRRRAVVAAGICLLGLIGTASLGAKLLFCASMILWIGSFPQARLADGAFHRELYLAFVRVRARRWKLDRFAAIEIGCEEGMFDSAGNVFKLFDVLNQFSRLTGSIIPWLGGDHHLYLRAFSGKRVLAWQGSSDEDFQANLALLKRATGLPAGAR